MQAKSPSINTTANINTEFDQIAKIIRELYSNPTIRSFRPVLNKGCPIKKKFGSNGESRTMLNSSAQTKHAIEVNKIYSTRIPQNLTQIKGHDSLETILRNTVGANIKTKVEITENGRKEAELKRGITLINARINDLIANDRNDIEDEELLKRQNDLTILESQYDDRIRAGNLTITTDYKDTAIRAIKILAKNNDDAYTLYRAINKQFGIDIDHDTHHGNDNYVSSNNYDNNHSHNHNHNHSHNPNQNHNHDHNHSHNYSNNRNYGNNHAQHDTQYKSFVKSEGEEKYSIDTTTVTKDRFASLSRDSESRTYRPPAYRASASRASHNDFIKDDVNQEKYRIVQDAPPQLAAAMFPELEMSEPVEIATTKVWVVPKQQPIVEESQPDTDAHKHKKRSKKSKSRSEPEPEPERTPEPASCYNAQGYGLSGYMEENIVGWW